MTWRVAAAGLLALSPLYAQESTTAVGDSDSVVVVRPLTKYGILRTHLPDSEGAPQVAVSHARYIANFGTRDGVKPGAIFQVYKAATYVGLLRVEWVHRDSASLRLVNLDRKLNCECCCTRTLDAASKALRQHSRVVMGCLAPPLHRGSLAGANSS